MSSILIVEDEPKLSSLLKDYLEKSAYECDVIADGNQVIDYIRENTPQLMLLDIMLPGRDGIDILRELRTFSSMPVIMVTAKVEEVERLLGLEVGADDYICKPYSPREVVARVKAVLRRTASEIEQANPLINLDVDRFEATINGKPLKLTKTEFSLLKRLSDRPGQVFSRDKLIDDIYDDYRIVTHRTVDSHIKNLRKKIIGIFHEKEIIHSVYGVGYKLKTS